MTERISSLIDGELAGDSELDQALRNLGEGTADRERWDDYHLIGDALRATHGIGLSKDGFAQRLNGEPTILAPRRPLHRTASAFRWPLRMAASIAGLVFVGWTALSFFDSRPETHQAAGSMIRPTFVSSNSGGTAASTFSVLAVPAADSAAPPNGAIVRAPGAAQASSSLDDYVWAHQRFSPSSLTHDVAPYVRLVSRRGAAK
ncbi:MAG: hypothetical protein EXR39_16025 [Betaproteobacteria bacterium]|nr:hypothetical protein [Betaproteobacteria bacterium]